MESDAGAGPAVARDLAVESVSEPRSCDLLVNATTVGLSADDSQESALRELGLSTLDVPATVVDLVYGSHVTPICAWASAAGSRVVDGLEVLVRQGALSFELWTGREAPLEVMRTAAHDT